MPKHKSQATIIGKGNFTKLCPQHGLVRVEGARTSTCPAPDCVETLTSRHKPARKRTDNPAPATVPMMPEAKPALRFYRPMSTLERVRLARTLAEAEGGYDGAIELLKLIHAVEEVEAQRGGVEAQRGHGVEAQRVAKQS